MSNLIVFTFKNETGAEEMRDALVKMQKEKLITLEDAAVVIRKQDGKVKVKQAVSLVGAGALGGSFWGLLIGLLFWAPWLGLAIGAATGALAGKMTDTGVDDKFIKEVGEAIEPGNSALFLLVIEATTDKVLDGLKDFDAEVYQTSLSKEDEAKLRETFAHSEEE
ncbi:MAG: DUF1269 domain-containing protein [Anaerolineales bacterium]|nr:DUF1269 domain-containing protein [Anaerolineales bacterium]MCK5428296.1 DUF1269 domain-containing protein [Anaerolineales bacterium]